MHCFLFTVLLVTRINFFGSSVCNGQGAEEVGPVKHGYAWQYSQLLAARHAADSTTGEYAYRNTSVNGINTVRHAAMLESHLLTDSGAYAVIGLGLGNEGLHEATNKQAVYDQWKTNMSATLLRTQQAGKTVVVTNNYPRGDYNATDYGYVKAMNLEMHEWEVPTVNLLGTLDNCEGNGQWAPGYQNGEDIYHPNTAGYTEMMHAFVPSLFDALQTHKPKNLQIPPQTPRMTQPGNQNRINPISQNTTTRRTKIPGFPPNPHISYLLSPISQRLRIKPNSHRPVVNALHRHVRPELAR